MRPNILEQIAVLHFSIHHNQKLIEYSISGHLKKKKKKAKVPVLKVPEDVILISATG